MVEQAGEARSARIESLRAIAALAVVIGHVVSPLALARPDDLDLAERLAFAGQNGVVLFFALSGYLLFLPFVRRVLDGAGRPDLRRYALNRALRLLPLYYATLAVYLVIREDGGTLERWLTFATFSENFFEDSILGINPVLWSLVVEVHFYILLPVLALALGRVAARSPGRVLVVIAVLGAASFALRWATLYTDPSPDPYLRYSLASCFMFFAPGMALAVLRAMAERRGIPGLHGRLGTADVWVLGSAVLWAAIGIGNSRGYLMAPASFLLLGACVLPLGGRGLSLRALQWRPLALVGVVSYSIYLWHLLLLVEIFRPANIVGVWAVLPVLPAVIAVAALSYACVERPFLRLRRRWAA